MSTRVQVKTKPVNTILTRLGVDRTGDVQMQTTRIINQRITRYMPYRFSTLSTKLKYIKSPTEIEVLGPYARVQYYGKVMVNAATGKGPMNIPGVGLRYKRGTVLKVTDRDMQYDTTKNPKAGPFWDKRMMAEEGAQIAAEIQEYVNRKRGKR